MIPKHISGDKTGKQNAYGSFAAQDAGYIHPETLRYYCCTNETLLAPGTHVTGFVLEFPGLGGDSCLGGRMDNLTSYENAFTRRCAENGIVAAYMFPGPWS